jgi:BirA family biotin operon repressor/biotin-[acetyl-CoA-carboxylase] ligase
MTTWGDAVRRFHFEQTDSTNTQARRLADEHPGERLLVTAAMQSAGRGRLGRTWSSPPGGAWLSVAWPVWQPSANYAGASLAAALAVRRGLSRVAPEAAARLAIKWPNDVLLDGRKVAGILCESFPGDSGGDKPGLLVVGVGVNVDFDAATLGGELRHPATSLRDGVGPSVSVEDVANAVAAELETALGDCESAGLSTELLDELQSCLAYRGEVMTWHGPAGPCAGLVLGIDAHGRLILEGAGGRILCESGELEA